MAEVLSEICAIRTRMRMTFAAIRSSDDYNDQDVTFVKEMIKHHDMAISMASKQIKNGKNTEVVALAKAIKKAQKSEIATMKQWLSSQDISQSDKDGM